MELVGTRQIRAPTKDWLTKEDVGNWLGISEDAVDTLVKEGSLPQGVAWTGKRLMWWWEDVIYRELYLKVAARLIDSHAPPTEQKPTRRNAGE